MLPSHNRQIHHKTGKKDNQNTLKPKNKTMPKFPKIPTPKSKSKKIIHHEDVKQEDIVLNWPLPGFKQTSIKDRLKIGVASYILGGGPNSILNKEIRERQGLAYWINSSYYSLDLGGNLQIATSTEPKNKAKCLRLIRKLTYDFINSPISTKQLQQAINFMNAQTTINFDSVDKINSKLISNIFDYKKPVFPEDYIKISKTLTPQSINSFMKKYINPKNELIAIMRHK